MVKSFALALLGGGLVGLIAFGGAKLAGVLRHAHLRAQRLNDARRAQHLRELAGHRPGYRQSLMRARQVAREIGDTRTVRLVDMADEKDPLVAARQYEESYLSAARARPAKGDRNG